MYSEKFEDFLVLHEAVRVRNMIIERQNEIGGIKTLPLGLMSVNNAGMVADMNEQCALYAKIIENHILERHSSKTRRRRRHKSI